MTKTRKAGFVAAAVTISLTLFNVESSGAFAQVPTNIIALPSFETQAAPEAAETATIEPRFMASPMVQALPETAPAPAPDPAPAPAPTLRESSEAEKADSLIDLVAAVDGDHAMDDQLQCLAGAIYFEAKGEPLDGQLAVGRVIVNRAASGRFPSTYCGVVYQRSQFSFVRGGQMPRIATGSSAWRRAKAIARIAHESLWQSPAQGALFFHARRVNPGWRLTRIAAVQNHVFYR